MSSFDVPIFLHDFLRAPPYFSTCNKRAIGMLPDEPALWRKVGGRTPDLWILRSELKRICMAGGFRGSGFLLWPSYRSRSHDLWSGIWMEMTRSCDLQGERSNLARFGRRRFPLLQFSSAQLVLLLASVTQPSASFRIAEIPCWAAIRSKMAGSTGHLFSRSARNAHEELLAYRASGEEGQISAANNSLRVAMFHLQARRS
jgi:hypothetical protein